MGGATKNPPFWICFIFGKWQRRSKWHSLVLQFGGLVEMIPSKKKKPCICNFQVPPCGLCFTIETVTFTLHSLTSQPFYSLESLYLRTHSDIFESDAHYHCVYLSLCILDFPFTSSLKQFTAIGLLLYGFEQKYSKLPFGFMSKQNTATAVCLIFPTRMEKPWKFFKPVKSKLLKNQKLYGAHKRFLSKHRAVILLKFFSIFVLKLLQCFEINILLEFLNG